MIVFMISDCSSLDKALNNLSSSKIALALANRCCLLSAFDLCSMSSSCRFLSWIETDFSLILDSANCIAVRVASGLDEEEAFVSGPITVESFKSGAITFYYPGLLGKHHWSIVAIISIKWK